MFSFGFNFLINLTLTTINNFRKLTFCQPLGKQTKPNCYCIWIRSFYNIIILSSTHALKQEFPPDQTMYALTFKLTHFTCNMGLHSFCLSVEQSKDRTIKLSTMSQILCYTTILEFFIRFQNKTHSLIV
jgi:hypothetical protein